jgi:hypothetical protein
MYFTAFTLVGLCLTIGSVSQEQQRHKEAIFKGMSLTPSLVVN